MILIIISFIITTMLLNRTADVLSSEPPFIERHVHIET